MVPKMRVRLECAKMLDKGSSMVFEGGFLEFSRKRKFDGSYGSRVATGRDISHLLLLASNFRYGTSPLRLGINA
jgi:hypothetical protein